MPDTGLARPPESASKTSAPSSPLLALDLARRAEAFSAGLVLVDATGDRLEQLAAAAAGFAPGLEVLSVPAWDSLPYDRSPPSASVIGRRVAALAAMAAAPARPRLVLTSARAVLGRVPPAQRWEGAALTLALGDPVQPVALAAQLQGWGYVADEHVDEPGQMAVRGRVIDVFPGDADRPLRLLLEDGAIQAILLFDPSSQRSEPSERTSILLRPVVELPTADSDPDATAGLVCVLDYLPGAAILLHPEVEVRWAELREQAEDAHAATLRARRGGDARYVPPPSRLFCGADDLACALSGRERLSWSGFGEGAALAPLHGAAAIATALRAALTQERAIQGRVVVAAGAGAERLHAALSRRAGLAVRKAADWADAMAGPAEVAAILPILLESGFERDRLCVLAAPDAPPRRAGDALVAQEPPRIGDIVVHRDHGVCRLRGLTEVEAEERVALGFADDAEMLAPVADLDLIWRYGGETGPVALDRVGGEGWRRRRDEITAEIADTARGLAEASAARAATAAPVIEPPQAMYARFIRRFAYPLSPDQADAIEATLADLASGRPMDRLVCGDVGFGKTEVALRAAAAVALTGRQVAIVAPTTVLARQHCDTFARRFAGLGVRVEPLLRGAASGAVRAGLADGSIGIVVGTHAVAADAVRFKDLALVVIDEEQRFGDAHKKRLATLRNAAGGVHCLMMTATPIPRTLQGAMVGLRQVSVIATPPVRRQPIRSFVLPWDPVVVREALLREHARGGQSFVVCPRIEDLAPAAARLAELAPELSVVTAHGRLMPAALEQIVSEFAAGEHDVLLATNIIEAGLDIPRANTILVTRPDRFGLSQLHQMRGRVGRGERRGAAYLLTEPGKALAAVTQRRLRTLEAQTQLGAGVSISLADMDARGAGDLLGERQAGHVRAIGTELYQHLLGEAVTGNVAPPRPEIQVEVAARIPEDLVPEPNLRLELYRRLSRLASAPEVDAFAEELADRFGDLPPGVLRLLDLARLRVWCAANGVARMDAGPQAVALTLADPARAREMAAALPIPAQEKNGRVVIALAVREPLERLGRLCAALAGQAPD